MSDFEKEVRDRIASYADNRIFRTAAQQFLSASVAAKYSYNFAWLSRPIIQYHSRHCWDARIDLADQTGSYYRNWNCSRRLSHL